MSSKKENFFNKFYQLNKDELNSAEQALKNGKFSLFNKDFFKIIPFLDIQKFVIAIVIAVIVSLANWNTINLVPVFGVWYFALSGIGIGLLGVFLNTTNLFNLKNNSFFNLVFRIYIRNCPPEHRSMRLIDIVFVALFTIPAFLACNLAVVYILLAVYALYRILYYILYFVPKNKVIEYIENQKNTN